MGHESNTFTPMPTTLEDFNVLYGPDLLNRSTRRGSLDGILATLQRPDIELVPSVAAWAMPGGVVERRAYETFKAAVLERAKNVDAVCLALHGAMRAEGLDYCEDDLLRDLRARVGPNVPVTIALDMHANIVAETLENVDALVAYHTAPHVDAFETGERAAQMLLAMLRDGVQPRMGFAKVPFLLPGEMAQTALPPMADMMGLVEELEARPEVLSASLANGHCWADVPDIGVAAVVVTDGDGALAQEEANRLVSAFWERRADFALSAEAYPVPQAVEAALAAPESTVFLSDSGDNPGAGGTTDVTALLRQLIEAGATNVLFASIWDAAAVQACAAAGMGERLTLSIGGKLDRAHGSPLAVSGTVRLLAESQWGRGGGQGPVAVFHTGGIDLILSDQRLSFVDPAQLREIGLEPLDYRIVVLKRGYLTAPFQAISQRSILALSPGATNCDLTQMTFTRVQRPMYPLDAGATWSPMESQQ
jgi:microcystin degradation protein MlrC